MQMPGWRILGFPAFWGNGHSCVREEADPTETSGANPGADVKTPALNSEIAKAGNHLRPRRSGTRFVSPPPQELLHFVMVAGHHKQKAIGAVLKNQPDVQPDPDLKKIPCQPANAQSPVPVRMPEIPFQTLEGQSDFPSRLLGEIPEALAERPAEIQRLQSARSFSRFPEKRLIFPRFRSAEICCSIRFSKPASSAGVAPYSRQA